MNFRQNHESISDKKGSNKSTKVYFSNFCDFITLKKFLSGMFLPLKYMSNIKVNILIIMPCIALHKWSLSKIDILTPVLVFNMFEVSVWWYSLSSHTSECTIWTWQSVSFFHKIWGVYFYTFTTKLYCPCKPGNFVVITCLACLLVKRNNDANKYFKCNKIHKARLSINCFT